MSSGRLRFVSFVFALILVALNGRTVSAQTQSDAGDIARYLAAVRAGVQPPAVEAGTKVLAVAVADLDADGDLDVVASDGSLDLLVWDNDGKGHLTRKYPKETRRGGWLPQTGSIDDGPAATVVMLLPRDASVHAASPARVFTLLVADWRAALPPPPADRTPRSTSTPRAPPSADSLS